MLINTAVLGRVEVDREDIFHLPDGLYGFDYFGNYALVKEKQDDVTLMWLQAVDANVPCFVVFDPFEIIDGFDPIVEHSDLKFLGCESAEDLLFLVIAVVPEDIKDITVNLKSPVVANRKNRRARQVILANRDYPVKFPLFQEEQGEAQGQ